MFNDNKESYQDSINSFVKQHDYEFLGKGLYKQRECYEINVQGQSERYFVVKKNEYSNGNFALIVEKVNI